MRRIHHQLSTRSPSTKSTPQSLSSPKDETQCSVLWPLSPLSRPQHAELATPAAAACSRAVFGGAVNGTRPTNRQTQREAEALTPPPLPAPSRCIALRNRTTLPTSDSISTRRLCTPSGSLKPCGRDDIEVPFFIPPFYHMPIIFLLLVSPVSVET
jgi:hypothetical protein